MTTRGQQGPRRPGTPEDPSLLTNPVPFARERVTYSIGPGAQPGASTRFRTTKELQVGMRSRSNLKI